MKLRTLRLGDLLSFGALIIAFLGGLFFGLFSCGGYAWHHQLFLGVVILFTGLGLALPRNFLPKLFWRLSFPLFVLAVYIFSQAAISPFYSAAPANFTSYLQGVVQALEFGPC